jgi:hypothetical protein
MPVDRWRSLGVTDKQAADKKALEFFREKQQEAAGILETKVVRDAAMRPLAEHLEDYVADLEKAKSRGTEWQRWTAAQDAGLYAAQGMQLESGGQCQRGFAHRLAKPAT